MNPTLGSAKVDKLLTQFSQRYANATYISESILPVLKVKEKTGKFAKYGKENFRVYTDGILRAPGVRANSIDYSVSQGTYSCQERALEKVVPDEYISNTDDPYDPKRDAVATIMDNLWVNQERALAAVLTSTSILTNNTTLSGTSQWSDYANSSPLTDIQTGINTVRTATGMRPNSVWMSYEVMLKLKDHPDVREQLKYTNGGQFSESAFVAWLKGHFMLDNVDIGMAVYDTADEGQTASLASVWGKDFGIYYKSPRPTLMQATFGYTFTDVARTVETYREEARVADVVRQRYSYDQNIMDPALAYLIKDAIV